MILPLVTLYRVLPSAFAQAQPEPKGLRMTDSAPSHRVPFLKSYAQEIRGNSRASEAICAASLQRNVFVTNHISKTFVLESW